MCCVRISRVSLAVWVGFVLGASSASTRGDEFDRIEGDTLALVLKTNEATTHKRLSINQIHALPNIFADARSAFLVARTDQGNVARLLVAPAFRKQPSGQGKPIPVLVLERFDTFESGNLSTRLARGKDILLFEGFSFDLDSGQVVPEGQGGDLKFESVKEGPGLLALGSAAIGTLNKAPATPKIPAAGPSPGRTVLPGDYAGRYRLFANGQWSGTLDLIVDSQGKVSGRFRSDLNGTSYEVEGQVDRESPPKAQFAIRFPRTRQEYEGLIWTEGKGAMAGTMRMLGRPYGFFSIREGGRFAPEGEEVSLGEIPKNGQHTVWLSQGKIRLDGQLTTEPALAETLHKALENEPATSVLVQAPTEEPFATIHKVLNVIKEAGISSIRLEPTAPEL